MTEQIGLFGLFLSGFLSATLLPGNSELALGAFIAYAPKEMWAGILIATLGNTLGALTTYGLGRIFAHKVKRPIPKLLQRYGVWALLLSWAPVVGDALCLASGFLRQSLWQATIAIAVGKFVRYIVIAYGVVWGMQAIH